MNKNNFLFRFWILGLHICTNKPTPNNTDYYLLAMSDRGTYLGTRLPPYMKVFVKNIPNVSKNAFRLMVQRKSPNYVVVTKTDDYAHFIKHIAIIGRPHYLIIFFQIHLLSAVAVNLIEERPIIDGALQKIESQVGAIENLEQLFAGVYFLINTFLRQPSGTFKQEDVVDDLKELKCVFRFTLKKLMYIYMNY